MVPVKLHPSTGDSGPHGVCSVERRGRCFVFSGSPGRHLCPAPESAGSVGGTPSAFSVKDRTADV